LLHYLVKTTRLQHVYKHGEVWLSECHIILSLCQPDGYWQEG